MCSRVEWRSKVEKGHVSKTKETARRNERKHAFVAFSSLAPYRRCGFTNESGMLSWDLAFIYILAVFFFFSLGREMEFQVATMKHSSNRTGKKKKKKASYRDHDYCCVVKMYFLCPTPLITFRHPEGNMLCIFVKVPSADFTIPCISSKRHLSPCPLLIPGWSR